jgi:D-sedoheptulose 7-phosphate isomerase
MRNITYIRSELESTQQVIADLSSNYTLLESIATAAEVIITAFSSGRKLVLAGNGGSAADAQHIAAEFVSRLKFDRSPLPAIAITADTAILTAIGNDYGYSQLFSRQISAYGRAGDVFIGITTSGRSENVLQAFHEAKRAGMVTIALCGQMGLANNTPCEYLLACPSNITARIQECHIIVAHLLCDLVERKLFGGAA